MKLFSSVTAEKKLVFDSQFTRKKSFENCKSNIIQLQNEVIKRFDKCH